MAAVYEGIKSEADAVILYIDDPCTVIRAVHCSTSQILVNLSS